MTGGEGSGPRPRRLSQPMLAAATKAREEAERKAKEEVERRNAKRDVSCLFGKGNLCRLGCRPLNSSRLSLPVPVSLSGSGTLSVSPMEAPRGLPPPLMDPSAVGRRYAAA
jgi:hypothetical protein